MAAAHDPGDESKQTGEQSPVFRPPNRAMSSDSTISARSTDDCADGLIGYSNTQINESDEMNPKIEVSLSFASSNSMDFNRTIGTPATWPTHAELDAISALTTMRPPVASSAVLAPSAGLPVTFPRKRKIDTGAEKPQYKKRKSCPGENGFFNYFGLDYRPTDTDMAAGPTTTRSPAQSLPSKPEKNTKSFRNKTSVFAGTAAKSRAPRKKINVAPGRYGFITNTGPNRGPDYKEPFMSTSDFLAQDPLPLSKDVSETTPSEANTSQALKMPSIPEARKLEPPEKIFHSSFFDLKVPLNSFGLPINTALRAGAETTRSHISKKFKKMTWDELKQATKELQLPNYEYKKGSKEEH